MKALNRGTPVLSFFRPYAPDLTGWFRDFGQSAANYDANGHYARIGANFNAFSYDQATNGVLTAQQITDGINSQTTATGVSDTLVGGNLRLSAADGRDIAISQTVAGDAAGGITAGAGGASVVNGVTFRDGTIGTVANATNGSTDATAVNGGTITLSATDNIVTSSGL